LGEIQKQVWTKYQGWIQHDEIWQWYSSIQKFLYLLKML
jgi:hypothetical protein